MVGRGRPHGMRSGGRWQGRGGWQQADLPPADDAKGWFAGRLPDGWFSGEVEISVDREEIIVVGTLPALGEEFADDAERAAAEAGRISRFREDSREERMEIARQAEHRYRRKVAWGARLGGTEELFTTLSVPVMTRLRQPERLVLDTLAGYSSIWLARALPPDGCLITLESEPRHAEVARANIAKAGVADRVDVRVGA